MKKIIIVLFTIFVLQPLSAMEPQAKTIWEQFKLDGNLRFASENKDIEKMRSCLAQGADPNTTTSCDANTLLMYAASIADYRNSIFSFEQREKNKKNSLAMCTVLLEAGANPNLKNKLGETALLQASRNGNIAVCKILIEAGADINAEDNKGLTALLYASRGACYQHIEICTMLIAAGADKINGNGKTALQSALLYSQQICSMEIIKLLINAGHIITPGLITHAISQENPSTLEEMLLKSNLVPFSTKGQLLTRARIWSLKKVCPRLPRDVMSLILKSDPGVWHDACCTPLKSHANHYEYAHLLPIATLAAAIRNGALDCERVIDALTTHKIAMLKDYIITARNMVNCYITPDIQALLNIDHLEQNYGTKIREVISERIQAKLAPKENKCRALMVLPKTMDSK